MISEEKGLNHHSFNSWISKDKNNNEIKSLPLMVQIEIYSNPDLSDDIQNESTEVNIIEENDSQTELTDVEKRAKRFEFTIMYFGQGIISQGSIKNTHEVIPLSSLFFCGLITGFMLLMLEQDEQTRGPSFCVLFNFYKVKRFQTTVDDMR